MGRWSQYDTDEERLPEGMQRIGYDADDETYTFRDADGSIWESAPGNRYGQLRRVTDNPPPYGDGADDDDNTRLMPMVPTEPEQTLSWRQEMMPLLNWFLLVGLFLLFVFWFIGRSGKPAVEAPTCSDQSSPYTINSGDTCWAIAENKGVPLEDLLQENEGLDCDSLTVGGTICVPTV